MERGLVYQGLLWQSTRWLRWILWRRLIDGIDGKVDGTGKGARDAQEGGVVWLEHGCDRLPQPLSISLSLLLSQAHFDIRRSTSQQLG